MYILKHLLFDENPADHHQQGAPKDPHKITTDLQDIGPIVSNGHLADPTPAGTTHADHESVEKASSYVHPTRVTEMDSVLSGFPRLIPAIVTKVHIGDVNPLGIIHNGSTFTHYGTPSGTIESVPGFEPAFKADVCFGADWLSFDPDGNHGRINLKGIARTESGQSIDFRYKGVIKMAPDVKKIFEMSPDAQTVPFGYATGHHSFLVADPKLKDLENSVFVSNGRIIVHEKGGLTVETRQSLVVAANIMD